MVKKSSLFFIIVVLLILLVSVFVFLNQEIAEPTITLPPATISTRIPPSSPSSILSEEDLTNLWVNGKRCPEKDLIPSKFVSWGKQDDIIKVNNLLVFVNSVNINFTNDATCEDAERIAQIINAKIIYFRSTTNIYGFEIPTRTKAELDLAINKIKSLNDPKIEMGGVYPSYPFIKTPPFVP